MLAAVRSAIEELTPETARQLAGKVRTAILDELRSQDPLSRRLRQKVRTAQAHAQAHARELEQSLGRQASVLEIAEAADLTETEVDRLLRLADTPTEPLSAELPDSGPTPAEAADASDRIESVNHALTLIPAREASVLRSPFYSDAGADEVSRKMGISVQGVRQIRDSGLRHMAETLGMPLTVNRYFGLPY